MGCNCKKNKKTVKENKSRVKPTGKKNVIKLTEKDLTTLINRVISEKNN